MDVPDNAAGATLAGFHGSTMCLKVRSKGRHLEVSTLGHLGNFFRTHLEPWKHGKGCEVVMSMFLPRFFACGPKPLS